MPLAIWNYASRRAAIIMTLMMLAGVFLTAISFSLNIHDIHFDGYINDRLLPGFPSTADFTKQVGYVWAPNWSLTGILFLPLALLNLLLAIRAIEPLLRDLVESGMLRQRNFKKADPEIVIANWRNMAGPWALIGLCVALFSGVFILLADFKPVVLDWLWMTSEQRVAEMTDSVNPVTLFHPEHEFDWSVAATFDQQTTSLLANTIFSFAAYMVIPIFGTSVVFGAFIFLCAFCHFFTETVRNDLDLILVPDLDSTDARCGFERFEYFFHHLVLAAIFTGGMAVSMHLQNVFLRSVEHETIIDMVFGGATAIFEKGLLNTPPSEYLEYLTSTANIIAINDVSITLQTYAAPVVIFMVGAIVFICLWMWLRRAAVDGRLAFENHPDLTAEQETKLQNMDIWPIGWMSLDILLIVGALVFFSMYFVNFVTLVIVYFVFSVMLGSILKAFKLRQGGK